jgi:signal recognition particle subunit SRP54
MVIMFDSLGKNLSDLIRKITTGSAIDKAAVEEILKELQKILLQSDVDTNLTNELTTNVRKKCLEEKIPAGLTLREYILKTIYEELVRLLGENPAELMGKKRIMLVGLFGSGKTTTAAKLAKYFKKQGLKPALVCCDLHRPAAPEQLKQLAEEVKVNYFVDKNSIDSAKNGLEKFKSYDVIIFDTAGRDALDKQLADELKKLSEIIKPDEVLLAIPADLGKVARKQSEEFHKLVGVTGVIITKMDGTAKAGGALSATSVTGAKVKFIGIGEKIDALELYNPQRFVSRLLGLGDLETLMEKAKEIEIKKESVEKIVEGRFTLQDFYEQIEAMQKMGPLKQIASMIPGMGMMKLPEGVMETQEEKMKHFKYIMQSMTKQEKENPDIISASRIKRIAKGSGRPESEVRELLEQYNKMKKLMKSLGGMKGLQRGALKDLAKQFGFKL